MAPVRNTRTAAIIDLDDTLIAFDGVSERSWRTVLDEYAMQNPHCDIDTLYETIKRVNRWYWSDAQRHRRGRNDLAGSRRITMRLAADELPWLSREDAVIIADRYSFVRDENIFLLPGAHEMLTALTERGIRLVLVTNGESHIQRGKLKRFDIAKYFPHMFIEGELGYGKPEERVYREALSALKASPEETAIFGDNLEWEVRVPGAMGLYTVWHDWRKKGLPEGSDCRPDAIVTSLFEAADVIIGA
ncbi:MAG: HAD family hydrolase [Spirochaetota bacterium]